MQGQRLTTAAQNWATSPAPAGNDNNEKRKLSRLKHLSVGSATIKIRLSLLVASPIAASALHLGWKQKTFQTPPERFVLNDESVKSTVLEILISGNQISIEQD